MDQQRQIIKLGTIVIVFAISLRLLGGGILSSFVDNPRFLSFLIYLQTGRAVRFSPDAPNPPELFIPETTAPQPSVPSPTGPTEEPIPQWEIPAFVPEDLDDIKIKDNCDLKPDLQTLLLSPLSWTLTGEEPTVLIVHTHATECYTPAKGENYEQYGAFRTLDENYNMVSIGTEVAKILTAGGISVIHDTTYHDYPNYNNSYSNSRKAIKAYLKAYPSIQIVLDIHRDASGDLNNQMVTVGSVGGQRSAQLMLVVGTHISGGSKHPWQENLALALKTSVLLEQTDPGLTRYISLRSERFNMDLSPGSMLAEVGAAGNTHAEAVLAAQALARAILTLSQGANE